MNNKVIFCESGIGKIAAAGCTQFVIDKYSPDIILNVGLCGNLSSDLKIGSAIVSNKILQHDFYLNLIDKPINWSPQYSSEIIQTSIPDKIASFVSDYIIASGDEFISDNSKKDFLFKKGASVCDMESISVAQICNKNKINCLVIRGVSDMANSNSPLLRENIELAISEYSIKTKDIIDYLLGCNSKC
jgi:adenosylhomocysteine nucleosidase